MSVEHERNPNEMREVWSWALSWYTRPVTNPDKRVKQAQVVDQIKEKLQIVEDFGELDKIYRKDCKWCTKIIQDLYPEEWNVLGIHAVTAIAFGLRYVELKTGKTFDPKEPLPRWISEWAVW